MVGNLQGILDQQLSAQSSPNQIIKYYYYYYIIIFTTLHIKLFLKTEPERDLIINNENTSDSS
jgi:hypothetical protein